MLRFYIPFWATFLNAIKKSNFHPKMKSPVIRIPSPTDRSLGFLNISSNYSFILENKTWPTVEHYILAKQFQGSTLEENIRQAKTVLAARNLARPRSSVVPRDDGIAGVVKRVVYGPDGSVTCSKPNEAAQKQYLADAIEAKYSQNPKILQRLKQTEGIEIIDSKNPAAGVALMEFRDKTLCRVGKAKNDSLVDIFQMSLPNDDVSGPGGVTKDEKVFVENIARILEWTLTLENVFQLHTEMLEDVLYNIAGPKVAAGIIPPLTLWSSDISDRWGVITKEMPKFTKIFEGTSEILAAKFPPKVLSARDKIILAIYIASVLRWLRMDCSPGTKIRIYGKSKNLKYQDVILPPIYRGYRVNTRTKGRVAKTSSVVKQKRIPKDSTLDRGARYILLFKPHRKILPAASGEFSRLVEVLEKMGEDDREKWLADFAAASLEKQKTMILEHVVKSWSTSP